MGRCPIPQNLLCLCYQIVTNEAVTSYLNVSRETLTENITMALTNAERQAAFKARRAETMDALAQQNAALLAEVAELRAEIDRLKEKAHRLELSALRAQIKSQAPEKAAPAKKAAVKPKR